jgi:hypothetical protein
VLKFACNKIKLVLSNLKANFMKNNALVKHNQITDGGGIDIEDEEQFKDNKYDKVCDSSASDDELN